MKDWLNDVSKVFLPPFETKRFRQFSPSDVFIGYHDDAPASIVLRNSENINNDIVEQAKITFLACATPDAISRFVPSLYLPSQTPLSSEQLVSKVTNSSKVRVFHGQTTIKQPTLSISSHASKA